MKKTPIYSFALKSINTEQFAIIEDAYQKGEKTNFSSRLAFGVNESEKYLAIFAGFRFEQHEQPFLLLEIACHFRIGEENWNSFITETTKIIFPKDLVRQLTILAIGTARGVLHAKTENTPFNRFLLPVLDATNLIKEDVELDFAKD